MYIANFIIARLHLWHRVGRLWMLRSWLWRESFSGLTDIRWLKEGLNSTVVLVCFCSLSKFRMLSYLLRFQVLSSSKLRIILVTQPPRIYRLPLLRLVWSFAEACRAIYSDTSNKERPYPLFIFTSPLWGCGSYWISCSAGKAKNNIGLFAYF